MPLEPQRQPRVRRREAIAAAAAAAGAGALVLLRGGGSDAAITARKLARRAGGECVLTEELIEGPYYIDDALFRRNVKEGRPGTRLELRFKVSDESSCRPIRGAVVEIWHADSRGVYSGFGAAAGEPTFLRGQQRTDRDGKCSFKTIYPGWYPGRAVHVHVKVHVGGQTVHTGQVFFRDALSAKLLVRGPYAGRGQPDTPNATDAFYPGPEAEARVRKAKDGKGHVARTTLVVSA